MKSRILGPRASTKAASPSLPVISAAAWLAVTPTYYPGLPMVPATILEREASGAFRLSLDRTTVVSSFSSGISDSLIAQP
jgi:hypothetical protein